MYFEALSLQSCERYDSKGIEKCPREIVLRIPDSLALGFRPQLVRTQACTKVENVMAGDLRL